MTSKNGSQELISLLQYMRKTDINNPEITVRDKRLLEAEPSLVQQIYDALEDHDAKTQWKDIMALIQ